MNSSLVKLIPVVSEERGNLRYMGFHCPISYTDLGQCMVVHIHAEASPKDMELLNRNLRTLFGMNTLVFTMDKEIAFFVLEPMTRAETIKWSKSGYPAFVQDGREMPVVLDVEKEIEQIIEGTDSGTR